MSLWLRIWIKLHRYYFKYSACGYNLFYFYENKKVYKADKENWFYAITPNDLLAYKTSYIINHIKENYKIKGAISEL